MGIIVEDRVDRHDVHGAVLCVEAFGPLIRVEKVYVNEARWNVKSRDQPLWSSPIPLSNPVPSRYFPWDKGRCLDAQAITSWVK